MSYLSGFSTRSTELFTKIISHTVGVCGRVKFAVLVALVLDFLYNDFFHANITFVFCLPFG